MQVTLETKLFNLRGAIDLAIFQAIEGDVESVKNTLYSALDKLSIVNNAVNRCYYEKDITAYELLTGQKPKTT